MRSTTALAALATTAVALGAPTASSAATRFIQINGTDSGTCLLVPCKTITYAADVAAAGDTIKLAAGEYEQGATLTKHLTIAGVGAGAVGEDADPAQHTIIRRIAADTLTMRAGGALRDVRVIAGGGGDALVLSGASTGGADDYAVHDVIAESASQAAVRVTDAAPGAPVNVQWDGGGAASPAGGFFLAGAPPLGAMVTEESDTGLHVRDADLRGVLAAGRGHIVAERTSVRGLIGAYVIGGSVTLRRGRIAATIAGVATFAMDGPSGDVLVEDSIVDVARVAQSTGCYGVAAMGASGQVVLRRSTVRVRCAGLEAFGVGVTQSAASALPFAVDRQSTAVAVESATGADIGAAGAGVVVTAEHSAFTTTMERAGGVVAPPGSGTNALGPFALGEDLRPGPGSVLVDHGDPAAGEVADLAGAARTIDGDGDGTAMPDIGAYEAAAGTNAVPVPRVPAETPVEPPATTGTTTTTSPPTGTTTTAVPPAVALKLGLAGTPRARRAVKVRVTLSAPATVTAVLRRGTKTVVQRTVRLAAGRHTVVLPGRRVRAGRHTVRVSAKAADGRVVGATLKLRVRRR